MLLLLLLFNLVLSLASMFFKRIKSFVYLFPLRSLVCWWNDSRSPWRSVCTWNVCQRTLDSRLFIILLRYRAGVVILINFSLNTGFVWALEILKSPGIVSWHFPRLQMFVTHRKSGKFCIHFVFVYFALFVLLACVASVSSRGSSRKLGQEQKKKKKMNDTGGGGERRNLPLSSSSSSFLPLPLQPFFFRFRSNFRAIIRLETLATQAIVFSVCFYKIKHCIHCCLQVPFCTVYCLKHFG